METALKALEHSGLRVVDWMLTDVAKGGANPPLWRRLGNVIRYRLGLVSPELAARLMGGYSVLVLAE